MIEINEPTEIKQIKHIYRLIFEYSHQIATAVVIYAEIFQSRFRHSKKTLYRIQDMFVYNAFRFDSRSMTLFKASSLASV